MARSLGGDRAAVTAALSARRLEPVRWLVGAIARGDADARAEGIERGRRPEHGARESGRRAPEAANCAFDCCVRKLPRKTIACVRGFGSLSASHAPPFWTKISHRRVAACPSSGLALQTNESKGKKKKKGHRATSRCPGRRALDCPTPPAAPAGIRRHPRPQIATPAPMPDGRCDRSLSASGALQNGLRNASCRRRCDCAPRGG